MSLLSLDSNARLFQKHLTDIPRSNVLPALWASLSLVNLKHMKLTTLRDRLYLSIFELRATSEEVRPSAGEMPWRDPEGEDPTESTFRHSHHGVRPLTGNTSGFPDATSHQQVTPRHCIAEKLHNQALHEFLTHKRYIFSLYTCMYM